MQRHTFADVQNSRIPPAVGLAPTDSKLASWTNEAQERLLTKGLWWGTVGKWKMAAYGGLITLPPTIAAIETMAVNHRPTPVHDLWFEFLEFGFGTRTPTSVGLAGGSCLSGCHGAEGIPEADYRGNFPTFRDLTNNADAKKIVMVCDVAADVGATVTVTGYDNNGNWIRMVQGGAYADGEVIALAQGAGTQSVNYFSRIAAVQFSAKRNGQCWLYELDTVTSTLTMTGWYQWWETNPSYGRWLFPGIPVSPSGCAAPAGWQQGWTQNEVPCPPSSCYPALVEIIGKLEFIPVVLPTDFLIIQSLAALKYEVMCLKKEEDAVSSADVQESQAFEQKAIAELESELDHRLGSGRRIGMNVVGVSGDGQPIETFM